MRHRLPRMDAKPVRTVPPRLEKQKQHRSGHCRHLLSLLDDFDELPQHILFVYFLFDDSHKIDVRCVILSSQLNWMFSRWCLIDSSGSNNATSHDNKIVERFSL